MDIVFVYYIEFKIVEEDIYIFFFILFIYIYNKKILRIRNEVECWKIMFDI